MTLASCTLTFWCDVCGADLTLPVDTDLENIPSIQNLADHIFDANNAHFPQNFARIKDGHICGHCDALVDAGEDRATVTVESVSRIVRTNDDDGHSSPQLSW